jgi:uncharacterized protein YjbI with pentapeptide repeats
MDTSPHVKTHLTDVEITKAVKAETHARKEFVRVYAVNITFTDVDFMQCVFSDCYFRNCAFIRCNFTGAAFKSSNLRGSQFEACKFEFSSWEKTLLDDTFLDRCLPSEENLARDLVRMLRVNFSQIGNYEAVNNAASKEVKLTGVHLYKAAYSAESYYRSKYKGLKRIENGALHAKWKALDLLWGNGESILQVIFSAGCIIIASAVLSHLFIETRPFRDDLRAVAYGFWGLSVGLTLNPSLSLFLNLARLFLFGLFMAILVKRLSRR